MVTDDTRVRQITTYLEHSLLVVYLNSPLRQGSPHNLTACLSGPIETKHSRLYSN